jgi:mannosylglycerate hydrolase
MKKKSRRVDIKTSFDNSITHHRLRVLFPTNLTNAVNIDVEKHFTVETLPIEPIRNKQGCYRPGMNTKPQLNFVDVNDGKCGMAILNDGLCEYEVIPDDSKTIALTLLRSVKMRICTEPRVGTEFPTQNSWSARGFHEFRYSIYPHKGNWKEASLYKESKQFNIPLKLIQTNINKFGKLTPMNSFFAIDGDIVLSCIKKAQDSNNIIVRLFNPSNSKVTGKLNSYFKFKSAYIINMNEERIQKRDVLNNELLLEVGPNKIITLEIEIEAVN